MGLELYKKAGLSEYLNEFEQGALQGFVSPNTYDRLRVSLIIIANESKNHSRKKKAPKLNNEPDAILALRQRGRRLKALESDIHGQMKAYAYTEDPTHFKDKLYELAKKLLTEIEPGLDEVYSDIRKWETDGSIPVAGKDQIIADTVYKLRKYENLRKRISKVKGWLKSGELETIEQKKYESELSNKEDEMATIKQELNL